MNIIKDVKYFTAAVKYAVQFGQTVGRFENPFGAPVEEFDGIKIFVGDEYLKYFMGTPDGVPNGAAMQLPLIGDCIVVNSAARTSSTYHALLAHEVGHIHCRHVAQRVAACQSPRGLLKVLAHNPLRALGLNPAAILEEVQADAYAVRIVGKEAVIALLTKIGGSPLHPECAMRIKHIETMEVL